ncbi:hypothetical protein QBC46DRAFT_412329 [Diplogelasinospora grovesii]|uniref:Major facilitator superfamily (MFS) profile domain-containing protein n=1 Tax=Diplogelasinospora grovesii TaxID=303347 RepID=A0AAN6N0Y6_9PEZI|nr:hypothetical protein QBC46DRAFT_412329 [Diplogelasinospora grovesii]
MRVLMVEKTRRPLTDDNLGGVGETGTPRRTETDRLLLDPQPPAKEEGSPTDKRRTLLPILFCLGDKQLLAALALSLIQLLIIGTYDATLSLESTAQFDLSSDQVGFIYLALEIPPLIVAPLAGAAVDRCGPRTIGVFGYSLYAPALATMPTVGYLISLFGQQGVTYRTECPAESLRSNRVSNHSEASRIQYRRAETVQCSG